MELKGTVTRHKNAKIQDVIGEIYNFHVWIGLDELYKMAPPNDTAYMRRSCHAGYKLVCKLCRNLLPPAMGARFTVFWPIQPCGPSGWQALLLTNAGDVETNPGPTRTHK